MLYILNTHVLGWKLSMFNELSNTSDCNCCPDDMSSQDKDKNI